MAASDSVETIGLISDTHGVLDESAITILKRSTRRILHAGDVGDARKKSRLSAEDVIKQLENMTGKEVLAVRGNVDEACSYGREKLDAWKVLDIEGRNLLMLHICKLPSKKDERVQKLMEEHAPTVVLFGHSHIPAVTLLDGCLFVNPGSAGPSRFKLPRSVALLMVLPCGGLGVEFFSLDAGKSMSVLPARQGLSCPRQCASCQHLVQAENRDRPD